MRSRPFPWLGVMVCMLAVAALGFLLIVSGQPNVIVEPTPTPHNLVQPLPPLPSP